MHNPPPVIVGYFRAAMKIASALDAGHDLENHAIGGPEWRAREQRHLMQVLRDGMTEAEKKNV